MAQPAPKSRAKSPSSNLVPGAGRGPAKGAPNAGRPPSIVRDICRRAFEERVPILAQIADGQAVQRMRLADGSESQTLVSADVAERIKAIDTLGKYGVGTLKEVSIEAVRERVGQTLDVIRQHCPPDQAAALISALRPVWA